MKLLRTYPQWRARTCLTVALRQHPASYANIREGLLHSRQELRFVGYVDTMPETFDSAQFFNTNHAHTTPTESH